MIGVVLTAMMWDQVITTPSASFDTDPPRTRQEILDSKKQRLRKRFGVSLPTETEEIEDSNREFFASLAQPNKTPTPAEVAGELIHEPQNILVVAPHPDDEILCCASTISVHIEQGDKVSIIVITDGDGKDHSDALASLDYGSVRQDETREAASILGISAEDVMFLGFPDGHLLELEKKHRARSKFTRLMSTLQTSLFPGTPYTWGGLQKSLRQVLEDQRPDIVYLPGQLDLHSDHQVTGRAVKRAASSVGIAPEWKHYYVHLRNFSSAYQEVDEEKLDLIRIFESQRHDYHHTKFLEDFASRAEIFW